MALAIRVAKACKRKKDQFQKAAVGMMVAQRELGEQGQACVGGREPGSPNVLETVPHVACQLGALGLASAMQQCHLCQHSPLLGRLSLRVWVYLPAGTEATLGHRAQCIHLHLAGMVVETCLEHQEPDTS